MTKNETTVVKLSQEVLLTMPWGARSVKKIVATVSAVVSLSPRLGEGVSYPVVVNELIRRNA